MPPESLDLEPKVVLKATVEARAALAPLAQVGQLLPNTNVLIHAVPLLEAQVSSEIEIERLRRQRLDRDLGHAGNVPEISRRSASGNSRCQGGIRAVTGEELARRAELDDPTRLEDRDQVERSDDESDHESEGDQQVA